MWNSCQGFSAFQHILWDFRLFQRISLARSRGCFQAHSWKMNPTTWLSTSKSLRIRCSSFPESRFSGSQVTLNMTPADENLRLWTFFNDFRHKSQTCLSNMDSASYGPYEKKLNVPRDSAHRNISQSDNQKRNKPGFPTQVKPYSRHCWYRVKASMQSRYPCTTTRDFVPDSVADSMF